jgi:hypothetical protein
MNNNYLLFVKAENNSVNRARVSARGDQISPHHFFRCKLAPSPRSRQPGRGAPLLTNSASLALSKQPIQEFPSSQATGTLWVSCELGLAPRSGNQMAKKRAWLGLVEATKHPRMFYLGGPCAATYFRAFAGKCAYSTHGKGSRLGAPSPGHYRNKRWHFKGRVPYAARTSNRTELKPASCLCTITDHYVLMG